MKREGYLNSIKIQESTLVERCVASHCRRIAKTYYFKGQGEIDIIWLKDNFVKPIKVKGSNQLKPNHLKMLKQCKNSLILGKDSHEGLINNIRCITVYNFLYDAFS